MSLWFVQNAPAYALTSYAGMVNWFTATYHRNTIDGSWWAGQWEGRPNILVVPITVHPFNPNLAWWCNWWYWFDWPYVAQKIADNDLQHPTVEARAELGKIIIATKAGQTASQTFESARTPIWFAALPSGEQYASVFRELHFGKGTQPGPGPIASLKCDETLRWHKIYFRVRADNPVNGQASFRFTLDARYKSSSVWNDTLVWEYLPALAIGRWKNCRYGASLHRKRLDSIRTYWPWTAETIFLHPMTYAGQIDELLAGFVHCTSALDGSFAPFHGYLAIQSSNYPF